MRRLLFAVAISIAAWEGSASASIAYGSLNNFDTVNDTGQPCHGFEIEIEDIHSRDITYTYDWNHYGTPTITEDNSNPLHPRVTVRYASKKNPDGSWAAYTAVPAGPINPTDGHQFTNPSVNFGGEHFGVGFYGQSTAVRYFWLVDNGSGNLARGGIVNISTPTFVYYPPAPGIPAQVNAVIEVPEPVEVPVLEFGDPMWVKVTRTQTHNNQKVELRDLVSDDPADPNDQNWKNGEPDEVEVEWQLMQTEFNQVNGGNNGVLENAPQELPNGDEVVTLRYDFYRYAGPIDAETGEAQADRVGLDDLHGDGIKLINGVEVDLSTVVVVGDYIGAQMAGFDAAGQIGLIDHLQDGEINLPYVDRSMVIGGTPPIVTTLTGTLPNGMTLDTVTGVLSGTPTESGVFTFTLHSTDAAGGDVTMSYDLTIAETFVVVPQYTVTTSASPVEGGVTSGDGVYESGTLVNVLAEANPGYQFVNWTENGTEVSIDPSYAFNLDISRDLVANFELIAVTTYTVTTAASPFEGGNTTGAGVYESGAPVTVDAVAAAGYQFVNWTEGGVEVSVSQSFTFSADADHTLVANFALITYVIGTSASPAAGGVTSGDGTYNSGDSVTVSALANAGYQFVNWTEGGVEVSVSPSFTFSADADHSLVANFALITYVIGTSASPAAGGVTSGDGTYNSGDSVTVSALANAGYQFVNWTEGGVEVSVSPSFTFSADADHSLVANFAIITYVIGTSASPAAGGVTSGDGTYNSGDSVTVSAVANIGYQFVNWTEGGVEVSTSAAYTFSANADRALVANFAPVATGLTIKEFDVESTVRGGSRTRGVVVLSAPAPAGGTFVSLSSSRPGTLHVPAMVYVRTGRTEGRFNVVASAVRRATVVQVTATLGSSSETETVTVIPRRD